jgi:nicotinamidase-related amidase
MANSATSTRELLRRDDHLSALLVIDVINQFAFPDGPKLLAQSRRMARPLLDLLETCRSINVPVIYVNDNFGDWRCSFNDLVAHCLQSKAVKSFVATLKPDSSSYHILKPMHSGFYQTSLEVLLRALGVNNLVLSGLATDYCIEFTAKDAFMRGYGIYVPNDCCASVQRAFHTKSIEYMSRVLNAFTERWEA